MNGLKRSFFSPGKCRCTTAIWFITTTTLLWTVDGKAQSEDWLTLYPTEVEARLRYEKIDQHSSGDSNYESQDTSWEIGVSLTQEGHIVDPDLAWFLLDIEPALTRDKFESTTFNEENDGDLLDYFFQLSLLRSAPRKLSYDVQALRSSSLITGSLGSEYDNVIDSKQATINWKTKAFPMSFSYSEELLEQEFRTSQTNQVSKRDEFLESLMIKGRSSKLSVQLDHNKLDDRVMTRDNDYQQSHANANHRLSWGKGSTLQSRFDFYEREGFNANKRKTLEEIASIQHTADIDSQTSYRYYSVTQNTETVDQQLKFELNHKLYKNLTTTASAYVNSSRSDIRDEQINKVDLDSYYHKRDFFGAAVNAGLGVGYRETDRDSSTGLLDIIDERHTVSLIGAETLNTRFILTATIIVTNEAGTLVYLEGFDYEVNDLAGDLTEIQIIPGGRINQGDTILVSYQSSVLPSQQFSSTQTRYNIGIDLGWVRFSHLDRKSNDKLLSGADQSFLNDTRYTLTDLEFSWEINNNELVVSAERRFTLAGGFEFTAYTYRQLLSWIHSRDLRWNLSVTESFTQQLNRDSDLYSLDLSIDWRPLPNLSVRPTLGIWKRKDKRDLLDGGDRDDEFLTAGFRMNWKYRQVVMDFSYYHNRRNINSQQTFSETETDEDRVMFNLTRRFL